MESPSYPHTGIAYFLRGCVLALGALAGWFYGDLVSQAVVGAVFGLVLAALVVGMELYLARLPLRRLVGGAVGLAAGLVLGLLAVAVLDGLALPPAVVGGASALAAVGAVYIGLSVGARRGAEFSWKKLVRQIQGGEPARNFKILDTSVIIDGRIADIVDTGFLEGTLLIPSFVLQELQAVADSSDPLKRHRGRKGLDVLRDLKRSSETEVEFPEVDFPDVREVDQKLIELAKMRAAPIVTNDFNLNKVAQLRGVSVLNINELANALKPVVLPGENLSVLLVKEGKEKDQAVAYLDDGTMVVVDGARHLIGTKIDVIVTSTLQTSAGKMIFGIWKEDNQRRQAIHQRKAE